MRWPRFVLLQLKEIVLPPLVHPRVCVAALEVGSAAERSSAGDSSLPIGRGSQLGCCALRVLGDDHWSERLVLWFFEFRPSKTLNCCGVV